MFARLITPAITLTLLVGAVALAEKPVKQPVPKAAIELATADNKFGLDMFKRLHKDGENTFMSPTSIAMAIQMVAVGARGETLKQMNTSMHTGELNKREANKALLDALNGRQGVKLNVANSVWGNSDRFSFNGEYIADVQNYFDSSATSVSFEDPATVDLMNDWISDKTDGLIKKMISEIGRDEVAFLVNAIYFKGDWSNKFDKGNTKDADWHFADGRTGTRKLMRQSGEFKYSVHNGVQVIRLPYGTDEQTSMWIALPPKESGVDALVKQLDLATFDQWRTASRNQAGSITIPRFKMTFKSQLNEALIGMGMSLPFSGGDLSGIGTSSRGSLSISRVLHEAVIMVNEEGTEAAAATVSGLSDSVKPKPFSMVCDRPFLLFIADDPTGAILFMGAVHNPKELD